MIPKLIILYYFIPLCLGCLQTAQRSADAVIQRTADSADSDAITPNAQMLPSSDVQKAKQNSVVDLSSEPVGSEESSAVSQVKLSSGVIETAETDQAVHVKRGRKLANSKHSVRTSAVPRKNKLAQTTSSETEASSATAKTKGKKTISPSSLVITKSTLPNGGDESDKLLPEHFEAEEKKAVEEETEQEGVREERKEAGENEAAEREAEKTKSSENQAGGTEVDEPGEDDETEVEKKRTEENGVEEEEAGKEDTTSSKSGETVAGEKGEEQNKAAEKKSQKIELPETGQRLTPVTVETDTRPKVPEEINLCHTCDLSNLQKIMGNNNETSQFYEPYIGERTFSTTGCAQTLAYCNVPLYLGKWPDNFMEFHPVGPMYRAVRGGGLASEISCSKDGQWKVGSRNIFGVSCVHE